MDLNQSDFDELARRAAQLTLEAADVPRFLKVRFGAEHELAKSADEMLGLLEKFVRELRSFQIASSGSERDPADA